MHNVDGMSNQGGMIEYTAGVLLEFNGHLEVAEFFVMTMSQQPVILGWPWFVKHNPSFHWTDGQMWMDRCLHSVIGMQ